MVFFNVIICHLSGWFDQNIERTLVSTTGTWSSHRIRDPINNKQKYQPLGIIRGYLPNTLPQQYLCFQDTSNVALQQTSALSRQKKLRPIHENCVKATDWETLLCEVVSVVGVKEPLHSVKLTVMFVETASAKAFSTSQSPGLVTQGSRESFYTSVSQVLPTPRRENHQFNQECATLTNYNMLQN